jgi:polyhydroxybutyrate depolymerase
MKRRNVIAAVLVLLSLPSVLALGEAVSFYQHNSTNGRLISSGIKREYLLYVPRSYDPAKRTPLVISMHAAALWPTAQMETSGWNKVAERAGFIVVYPAGMAQDGPRIFHVEPGRGLDTDVRYISDLIDTLRAHYNIDTTMIYANGLSNGGGMSFALSCMLHDRIAAVGLVASAQTLPFEWCPDKRPVPMIAFHGTADPVVPYHGGVSWIMTEPFPDFAGFVRNWARRNHCKLEPADSAIAVDVVRHSYDDCSSGEDVVFYTLIGGGHSWPGGGPLPEWLVGSINRHIDATTVMWQFFQRHHL